MRPWRSATSRERGNGTKRGSGSRSLKTSGLKPIYRPGVESDFERLYNNSYARLVYTLFGILGDHAAAEDCAQEAFARAFRVWDRWKPDAPAEAWLHRIALNVAFSHRRRQRLHAAGELVRRLGRPAPGRDPAEVAEWGDLHSALSRLPPKQAAIIVLRHHHGYSNREIAAALQIPEATVASRLATAKARLRQHLGDAWGESVTSSPLGVTKTQGTIRRPKK
jgi:RNA polymerase sigma factor (sigma-70 family)